MLNIGVLNVVQHLLPFIDEGRKSYFLGEESLYITGFKVQFVAFNSFFLFLFIYIYEQINKLQVFHDYKVYLKYYILSSSVFFLMFHIPYSDRVGLMSWVVIPVLCSPVFSVESNRKLSKILMVLLLVFIFIFFQYYE